MNTARSKFEVTSDAEAPEAAAVSDEEAQRQALRAKWRELKKEFPDVKASSDKES
jgi:hypothetical protein